MRINSLKEDTQRQSPVFFAAAQGCLRPGGLELTRRGLALCTFPRGACIVDVGCGAGATVRLLRELGYGGVGVDPHPPQAGEPFPYIKARAEALPFAPQSVHGIICECVLSLLDNRDQALRKFWEVCLPGGCLLLTDLYLRDAQTACNAAALFKKEELEALFSEAGWQVERFEDHSRALRDYAAQMLWHTGECTFTDRNEKTAGEECGVLPLRAYGYGLWTARKEA